MAVQHREVLVGGEMDEPALLHAGGGPRRVASAKLCPTSPAGSRPTAPDASLDDRRDSPRVPARCVASRAASASPTAQPQTLRRPCGLPVVCGVPIRRLFRF
jgi:hypothetical protein